VRSVILLVGMELWVEDLVELLNRVLGGAILGVVGRE
jgi:hypothetical protein